MAHASIPFELKTLPPASEPTLISVKTGWMTPANYCLMMLLQTPPAWQILFWPDAPTLGDKVRFLSNPAAYSCVPGQVIARETHMSWVFMAGDRVYKLKKPVRFAYLDFSTLDRRAGGLPRGRSAEPAAGSGCLFGRRSAHAFDLRSRDLRRRACRGLAGRHAPA